MIADGFCVPCLYPLAPLVPNYYVVYSSANEKVLGTAFLSGWPRHPWRSGDDDTLTQLPACVSPQNAPVLLLAGKSSKQYTVTKGKGSYPYKHHPKRNGESHPCNRGRHGT